MGSLSAGRNQQQQTSSTDSASQGYGYNQAFNQAQNQSGQSVWGAQQPGLEGLYGAAQQLLGGGGQAQPGQAVAQQGIDAWGQAMRPGSNPFFDQSVQASIDQATRGFNQNVLPELEARGVGAGQYGSSRDQLARGQAAGDFGQSLAQTAAQQYAQQYAGDQSRQAQLIGQTGQMQATQYAPLSMAQQLLGGPTVLGQSTGQSMGQSLGENFAQAYSHQVGQGSGSGSDQKLSILNK